MQFIIKKRDELARIGLLKIEKNKIKTPNIIYPKIKDIKTPDFSEILLSKKKNPQKTTLKVNRNFSKIKQKDSEPFSIKNYFFYTKDSPRELHIENLKKINNNQDIILIPPKKEIISEYTKNKNSKFFIITNSSQLFQQPKKFVDFIFKLKEKINYEKNIYLPAIAEPQNMALLTYLGIDFFDTIQAIIAARNKQLFFPNGKYNLKEFDEIPCNCPICQKKDKNPNNLNFNDILFHNYYQYSTELAFIKNSIKNSSLEQLIETRIKNNSHLTTIYRTILLEHYEKLEKVSKVSSNKKITANCYESLYKPEIIRFQKRLIKNYKKPDSSKILLVLPCSAKKPYSFSKSHRLFKKQLYDCLNPEVIHELIITSPLGLVPRELEIVYPANNYDIPVTGHWDENEKNMIKNLLEKYLETNQYEKIIVHLSEDFIQKIFLQRPEETIFTCETHPTSKSSLNNLKSTVEKIVKNQKKVDRSERKIQTVKSLADYQFGQKISSKLMKNTVVKGKYPYLKIFENNKQLGMMSPERGYISLTLDGAEKIKKDNQNSVFISPDFKLVGSVFSPGITDADTNIRSGDEVLVFQKNKLIAVGVSQMSGDEMNNTSHGEAVKVRHLL
jgi:archaeosine synthase alpha-subunit